MKIDPRSIVTLEDVRRWLLEVRDDPRHETTRLMAKASGVLEEYERSIACTDASVKVLEQAIQDIKKVTVLEGAGPLPWKPEPLPIDIDRPFESIANEPVGPPVVYDQVWRVRTRLPGRLGTACRVLKRGRMNSILVEFESDKYKVITSRNYVRARKDKKA